MLTSWSKKLDHLKSKQIFKQEQLAELEPALIAETELVENLQVARALIQQAAVLTQESLSSHVGALVTLALRAVFTDPYEFKVEFGDKRGATECELLFTKDGNDFKPLESCGYGPSDVASFALRIAYWGLGHTRPVLVWDEPFRQLDRKRQSLAAEMVKTLSKELGLQLILITHSEELAECADRVFRVSIEDGISNIEQI